MKDTKPQVQRTMHTNTGPKTTAMCVGESMIEIANAATSPSLGYAGDSLNIAIYLRRMAPECQVNYVSRLGDDEFSRRILSFMANEGLDTSTVECIPDRLPGLYAITVKDGERNFHYWRSETPARELLATPAAELQQQLEQTDCLVVTGITLAILRPAARRRLIACARRNPNGMAYVVNHRPRLWSHAQACHWHLEAVKVAHTVFVSKDDLAMLWPQHKRSGEMFKNCHGDMVLTLGDAGCEVWRGDMLVAKTSAKRSIPVDTTAAGDSFAAAYLASKLTGGNTLASAKQGCQLAAAVIQCHGAIIPLDAMPK